MNDLKIRSVVKEFRNQINPTDPFFDSYILTISAKPLNEVKINTRFEDYNLELLLKK